MTREFLRVKPTSAGLDADVISTALTSLHKLSGNESDGISTRLTPFRSEQPVTFEFVAVSEGPDAPVEFYYGADARLDVLEQRLRSIYPASYEMERVEVDLTKRLLQPTEFSREEFTERLDDGRLYHEFEPSANGRATVSDGGEVAVAIWEFEHREYGPEASTTLNGVQMRAEARKLSSDEYPQVIEDFIEKGPEPKMPPYAVYKIKPRRVYVPVLEDGVNKRVEVDMW